VLAAIGIRKQRVRFASKTKPRLGVRIIHLNTQLATPLRSLGLFSPGDDPLIENIAVRILQEHSEDLSP